MRPIRASRLASSGRWALLAVAAIVGCAENATSTGKVTSTSTVSSAKPDAKPTSTASSNDGALASSTKADAKAAAGEAKAQTVKLSVPAMT